MLKASIGQACAIVMYCTTEMDKFNLSEFGVVKAFRGIVGGKITAACFHLIRCIQFCSYKIEKRCI